MPVKIVRILLIAVAVEVLAILVLVALVAALGPSDPEGAQAYAKRLGVWVGPVAGFVLCIPGGWLAARRLPSQHVVNGLVLGAAVAAIDIALLVGGGAEFRPLFLVSNAGRVVAGTIGGWLAGRNSP